MTKHVLDMRFLETRVNLDIRRNTREERGVQARKEKVSLGNGRQANKNISFLKYSI
jgi:hypothetical protein